MSTPQDHDIRSAPRWTDRLIDRMFVPRSRQSWKHWLASALIGAAFGAGMVILSDSALGEAALDEAVKGAGSGAVIVIALVAAMLFIGIYVLIMGSSRRAMQRAMELDDAEPGETMMASFRLSALALGCQAALILLVVFDGLPAAIALAMGAALLIAEQWLAWRTYANMDELWRQATLESCALQSALVSLLLGGWAVLHAYGAAPALSPLAVLLTLLLSSVVTSIFASHRRGMFA